MRSLVDASKEAVSRERRVAWGRWLESARTKATWRLAGSRSSTLGEGREKRSRGARRRVRRGDDCGSFASSSTGCCTKKGGGGRERERWEDQETRERWLQR